MLTALIALIAGLAAGCVVAAFAGAAEERPQTFWQEES